MVAEVQNTMRDPFTEGWVPRLQFTRELLRNLRGRNRVLVQGPRRCGKTTDVLEVLDGFPKGLIVHCDLFLVSGARDFASRFGRAILRAISEPRVGKLGKYEQALRVQLAELAMFNLPRASDYFERVVALLRLPEEIARERPCIVVFDNIDEIGEMDQAESRWLLGVMRSEIQRQSKALYVFIGANPEILGRIFDDPKAAFYNSVVSLSLGTLSREEIIDGLSKAFRQGRRTLTGEAADRIVDEAGLRVGDIRRLAQALWSVSRPGARVTAADVARAVDVVHAQIDDGARSLLANATGNQRRALVAVACLPAEELVKGRTLYTLGIGPTAVFRRAIEPFCKSNVPVLERIQGSVVISDPFLRSWIQSQRDLVHAIIPAELRAEGRTKS